MYFSPLAARDFSSGVRSRGRTYFQGGRVAVFEADEQRVRALVHGTHEYEVSLELLARDPSAVVASCSCPYFDREDLCKHIWATVLEVEEKRLLSGLHPRDGRVRFMAEGLDDEYDEEDADDVDPAGDSDHGTDGGWIERRFGSRLPARDVRSRSRKAAPSALSFTGPRNALGDSAPPLWRVQLREEILYFLCRDLSAGRGADRVDLRVYHRRKHENGNWQQPSRCDVEEQLSSVTVDPLDRRVFSLLVGAAVTADLGYPYRYSQRQAHQYTLEGHFAGVVLSALCETGRVFWASDVAKAVMEFNKTPPSPLVIDSGPPWSLHVRGGPVDDKKSWALVGRLERDEEVLEPSNIHAVLSDGSLVTAAGLALLDDADHVRWLDAIRRGETQVTRDTTAAVLHLLYDSFPASRLDLPPDLRLESIAGVPRPLLKVKEPDYDPRRHTRLRVIPGFIYDGHLVPADTASFLMLLDQSRMVRRDRDTEASCVGRLFDLGCRVVPDYLQRGDERSLQELELPPKHLPRLVRTLVSEGWHVEADGKVFRQPGEFQARVSSGVDWFELKAEVRFGDETIPLPQLLHALERGADHVVLDDGSLGMLPEAWLRKYGFLLSAGKASGSAVRFRPSQLGFLDLLLSEQDDSTWDRTFAAAREKLHSFAKLKPRAAPRSFRGKLRPYQKDGLGWFEFLREFGFGGCLADDMGLGKTIQVLALLEGRRCATARGKLASRPSLVVAPRSLVFNWIAEAARFTPKLRVLDFSGPQRAAHRDRLGEFDVVVMTYGTLRTEIARLKDVSFDYVVLDEAQAIKNAHTATAKASRLLDGDHRLALSGTPVENHLGELWSILEFLNPGSLGSHGSFSDFASFRGEEAVAFAETLRSLIGPMILRRTKQDVASDLPEKTEKTIFCELKGAERKRYDELREHFRACFLLAKEKSLPGKARISLGSRKLEVLEALLRLRQAACHPALIDKTRVDESSAKLDVLLDELHTVVESGHKALVFSQFTSFLAILRKKLDSEGVVYEYLDGRTRRRDLKVERFQSDPDCKVFLISLKAGGFGLNLTAAEYVFLLDPWWNPAVELQAIDRTHRIGQSRRVFAYRLIAKDTVEERVLELQDGKRRLADAIISANGSLLKNLTRDDLDSLLS